MMRRIFRRQTLIVALILRSAVSPDFSIADTTATAEEQAADKLAITERAEQIVTPLKIDDVQKATRIRDLIVAHDRALREIHAACDARIAQAVGRPTDNAIAEAWRSAARKEADLRLFPLHRAFVARLEAELTPEQVNQVKDALTDGAVPSAIKRWDKLLPNLTLEQRATIRAKLLEAREYAMDAGSAEERQVWFSKCESHIQNDLSAAGIDIKQAEQGLAEREPAAANSK
jgi:hypothetical protein